MVPEDPEMVSERATGTALVGVFMVRVETPPAPLIDAGLKPPLVMPLGKPDSLLTLRLTVPLNPFFGVTVTVKVRDWPGRANCDEGLTAMSKSGFCNTVIV